MLLICGVQRGLYKNVAFTPRLWYTVIMMKNRAGGEIMRYRIALLDVDDTLLDFG